jgi:hypothetical protein
VCQEEDFSETYSPESELRFLSTSYPDRWAFPKVRPDRHSPLSVIASMGDSPHIVEGLRHRPEYGKIIEKIDFLLDKAWKLVYH